MEPAGQADLLAAGCAGSPRPCVPRALVCRFTDPKRSDVLVFSYPPDESREFMKRIVAIGGDDLHIEDQKI